jgi:hypothetical protein
VEFARRGIHREEGFEFRTAFPFGFLERRARVGLRREILVYPCLDPQPGFEDLLAALSGEVSAHYRGRGHDFYRIRPYDALESARHLDWKATAHTGTLQVREFEREEEPLVEILFDLDVPEAHREWFARVRFASQDFAATAPATGDIHGILRYLALASPRQIGDLPTPVEENSFHLIFTASPERFQHQTWDQARFVTPETLLSLASDR